MEELSVVAGTDLINGGRVEIDEERPGDVFAVAGLGEEGVEGTTLSNGGIGIRAAIRSEAVLKEVQFPSTVTQLGTSLTQMKMENL